jgi:hypothetical protein
MSNYTLHKIPEGFIITSNKPEEGINPEANYFDDKVDKNGLVTLPEIFTEKLNTYLVKGIKENKRYVYKVIAQQDQIDFSSLSEDEQKKIGWFNVEKIAKLIFPRQVENIQGSNEYGFIRGFQHAQQLLSDRRFTLEDVHRFLDLHTDSATIEYLKKESLKFLSQPKSWNVEIQHVCDGIKIEGASCSKNNNCTYPNCGKIKITKIL